MMEAAVDPPTTTSARVPPGRRVYAVGDIHGRCDLLLALEDMIVADRGAASSGSAVVIYLGDYIDRGASSAEVIEHLVTAPLAGFEQVHLKGNHEAMMEAFLAGPPDPLWLFNGGIATLVSYGVFEAGAIPAHWDLDDLRQRLIESLPPAHLAFLRRLKLTHVEGNYLFVHAGIRPGRAIDAQDPRDLLWIRGEFLRTREPFPKRVVHGHTITAEPEVTAHRIGIDTGAYFSDHLTCLVLEGDRLTLLST